MEDIIDQDELAVPTSLFRKPSLILRVKSMIIDTFFVIVLMYLASLILNSFAIESGQIRAISLSLIFLYEPIFTSINQTFGQKIMGIQVRNYQHLRESKTKVNINFFVSLFRYFIKIALGWISLLTIHSDSYGRAIHDKLSNSVMTHKN